MFGGEINPCFADCTIKYTPKLVRFQPFSLRSIIPIALFQKMDFTRSLDPRSPRGAKAEWTTIIRLCACVHGSFPMRLVILDGTYSIIHVLYTYIHILVHIYRQLESRRFTFILIHFLVLSRLQMYTRYFATP